MFSGSELRTLREPYLDLKNRKEGLYLYAFLFIQITNILLFIDKRKKKNDN